MRSAAISFLRAGCTASVELSSEVENRSAGSPGARKHVAASCAPLGERADHPFVALGERRLDLADRHPARRADGEPGQPDLHADRAPARADEPVVDLLAGEHDATQLAVFARSDRRPDACRGRCRASASGRSSEAVRCGSTAGAGARDHAGTPSGRPSRATSASIQSSTSAISVCASLPDEAIGFPIDTVSVPGRLPKRPFGQR